MSHNITLEFVLFRAFSCGANVLQSTLLIFVVVVVVVGTSGSSPWSTFCADSYFGIRSTSLLPQQHVKDPGYSAKKKKKTGGRLQVNTHAPYSCGFA